MILCSLICNDASCLYVYNVQIMINISRFIACFTFVILVMIVILFGPYDDDNDEIKKTYKYPLMFFLCGCDSGGETGCPSTTGSRVQSPAPQLFSPCVKVSFCKTLNLKLLLCFSTCHFG